MHFPFEITSADWRHALEAIHKLLRSMHDLFSWWRCVCLFVYMCVEACACTVWGCVSCLRSRVVDSPHSPIWSRFALTDRAELHQWLHYGAGEAVRGPIRYQSLPLCLCAFVWWPSKTSILASHRIGLLYKNTPANILRGWSGTEGMGAAAGSRDGWTKYSSEMSLLYSSFPHSSFIQKAPKE